ncbi:MAG TPA: helix-hairpin-helix domain-containing protein [Terriglobales bacterium]|nr:helix-hairpin-helix domain-containing protein [Terriglobales bacterium]
MRTKIGIVALSGLALGLAACSNNPATTRDQAANATEQLKQDAREAAGNVKKGAQVAKTDLTAAAEGVKQGLNDKNSSQVNVNTASKAELMGLQGIDEAQANAIIADRPYRSAHQIVSKGAVSEQEYQKIESHLTASSVSQK